MDNKNSIIYIAKISAINATVAGMVAETRLHIMTNNKNLNGGVL